jgi:hypothetical protein
VFIDPLDFAMELVALQDGRAANRLRRAPNLPPVMSK